MTATTKAPAHQYSVALRISGDRLEPKAITEALRMEPSQAWKKGEDDRPRSVTGGWELRVEPEDARFWGSLDAGLNAVLDRFEDRRDAFAEVALLHPVIWWIGHFQTSFDGGPAIAPQTLKRLGEFGIGLLIDNYFSPADETK